MKKWRISAIFKIRGKIVFDMVQTIKSTEPEASRQEGEVIPEMKHEVSLPHEPEREQPPASLETQQGAMEETAREDRSRITLPRSRVTSTQPVKPIDRLEGEIDDVLEENLKDVYLSLSPAERTAFRAKGEETRSRIRELARSVKINAKKIFQLIRDWLKMIPGVNRFFLEQEAKIKTDKILIIAEEERKRSQESL